MQDFIRKKQSERYFGRKQSKTPASDKLRIRYLLQ
jgi:hypothetical protein